MGRGRAENRAFWAISGIFPHLMSGGSPSSGVFVEAFLSLEIFHRGKNPIWSTLEKKSGAKTSQIVRKKPVFQYAPALFLRGSLRFCVSGGSRPYWPRLKAKTGSRDGCSASPFSERIQVLEARFPKINFSNWRPTVSSSAQEPVALVSVDFNYLYH